MDVSRQAFDFASFGFGSNNGNNHDEPFPEEEPIQPQLEFPLSAFPPVARNLIEEICRVELVPPSIVGSAVLGICSASLGAGIRIQSGPMRYTRPNIYVMMIAESGTGKAAVRHVMTPFVAAEEEILARWKHDTMPSLTTRIDALESSYRYAKEKIAKLDPSEREKATEELIEVRKEIGELQSQNIAPSLSVADVTKEKLAVIMSAQVGEAIASISREGRGVIDVICGRYNKDSSDEDFYTASYTGDFIKVDRISRPSVWLKEPCLAIYWMLQPDKYLSLLEKANMTESGMLQRFLLTESQAEPQEVPKEKPVIKLEVFKAWDLCIRSMIDTYRFREDPLLITPSPEAEELFWLFTNEIIRRRWIGGDLHDIKSYAARWAEQAWRLAGMWHILTEGKNAHSREFIPENSEKVLQVIRWFAQEQRLMLGVMRSKQRLYRLTKLVDILTSRPRGRCTLRDLRDHHKFERGEVETLAREYYHRIEILESKPSTLGGRPSLFVSLKG